MWRQAIALAAPLVCVADAAQAIEAVSRSPLRDCANSGIMILRRCSTSGSLEANQRQAVGQAPTRDKATTS